MDVALDSSIMSPPKLIYGTKSMNFLHYNTKTRLPMKSFPLNNRYPFRLESNCVHSGKFRSFSSSTWRGNEFYISRGCLRHRGKDGESLSDENGAPLGLNYEFLREILKRGMVLVGMVCGVLVYSCRKALASEGVVNAGYGVIGQSILLMRNAWPKTLQVLQVFKEQGLILALLLGLSAFFSMAETAITTLWPWKVFRFYQVGDS